MEADHQERRRIALSIFEKLMEEGVRVDIAPADPRNPNMMAFNITPNPEVLAAVAFKMADDFLMAEGKTPRPASDIDIVRPRV